MQDISKMQIQLLCPEIVNVGKKCSEPEYVYMFKQYQCGIKKFTLLTAGPYKNLVLKTGTEKSCLVGLETALKVTLLFLFKELYKMMNFFYPGPLLD